MFFSACKVYVIASIFFSFLCWFLHPNPRTAVKIFLLLVLFFHEVGMHCQCYGMNYLVVEIFSQPVQYLFSLSVIIWQRMQDNGKWKPNWLKILNLAKTIWITCSPTHIPVHSQVVSIIKNARKTKKKTKNRISYVCHSTSNEPA